MSDVTTVPYFITIGLPKEMGGGEIEKKRLVYVDLETETIIQVAKKFRKVVTHKHQCCQKNPAKLWWKVFTSETSEIPLLSSKTAPKIKDLKNRTKKEKVQVIIDDPMAPYRAEGIKKLVEDVNKEIENENRKPRKIKSTVTTNSPA